MPCINFAFPKTDEAIMNIYLRELTAIIILILALTACPGASAEKPDTINVARQATDYGRVLPQDSLNVYTGSGTLETDAEPEGTTLKDVVITATEGGSLSSSSLIRRDAMDHLQPTSFSDLLELLPGQISKDPQMNQANTITLRETGAISATGDPTSMADDYAITSLGTAFIVDGANMNTDASLNSVPGASSGSAEAQRSTLNRGVDMRNISTDNIESVEIIRGIPSSEYGNLTSGVVNIKRTKKKTPFTARLKVDEFSKLVSVGKGFGLGDSGNTLNFDAGYLDSKSDPRDSRETYRRINASVKSPMPLPPTPARVVTCSKPSFTSTSSSNCSPLS